MAGVRIFAFSVELDPSGERILTWAYDDRQTNPYSPAAKSKTISMPAGALPADDVRMLDEAVSDLLEIAEIVDRDAAPERARADTED